MTRIGRRFDMTPLALARDCRPGRATELGVDHVFARHELAGMVGVANALVICAPHIPKTENLMNRAAFETLKSGSILANIGRGHLVDEGAMFDKRRGRTVRLPGLDVFRDEPLPGDAPF